MKKINIALSVVVLTAVLLAACSGFDVQVRPLETAVASAVSGAETSIPGTANANATETPAQTQTPVAANLTNTPGIPVTGGENPARLSKQLDFTVWDKDGKQIGEVDDMVLDLDNNKVSYVVVGVGGFLGLGEKKVLVPWNSLKLDTKSKDNPGKQPNAFILQGNLDRLKNAPDLDLHSIMPKAGTPAGDWDKGIRSFWETGKLPSTPTAEATANPNMTATPVPQTTGTPAAGTMKLQGVMLASDALKASVKLKDGKDADLKDILVDVHNDKIQYIVIGFKFDDGDHLIPVPFKAFQWDSSQEAFILNVDTAALQTAPFLKDDQYPDTSKGNWDKDFAKFWQKIGTP